MLKLTSRKRLGLASVAERRDKLFQSRHAEAEAVGEGKET